MNLGEVPRKGPPVWREWLNRSRIGGKIVCALILQNFDLCIITLWRGARVVDSARLEIVCAFTGTVGSNPTLSALRVL